MNSKSAIGKSAFQKLAAATILIGLSASSFAQGHGRHGGPVFDYAKVLSSQPVVRYVTVSTPVKECWQETQHYTVHRRDHSTAGGTLLGAIVGGVVGHQFGSGRGNDAATAAGALIGAAIGNDSAHRRAGPAYGPEHRSRPVTRCETRHRQTREQRIDGYDVTYRYKGQTYATRMPYDPGSRLRVRVDIRPAR